MFIFFFLFIIDGIFWRRRWGVTRLKTSGVATGCTRRALHATPSLWREGADEPIVGKKGGLYESLHTGPL